ncbi:hypothetical protein PHLCEN_2v1154 [Hermanssonia centrifuga]|uniref:60S ribosomal protein L38 n=1 Tax=Hermanssonia centrifuga TaxID=98765 RepID=A0A2R6S421_9APHY|nr:hypothetical protein PHLCEN_2v1154 [Hermanssonia centrifuga]
MAKVSTLDRLLNNRTQVSVPIMGAKYGGYAQRDAVTQRLKGFERTSPRSIRPLPGELDKVFVMFSSVRRRFPQELVNMVIDNLHDSKSDLSSCSLVARSWTPEAQLHLFRRVCVNAARTPFTEFLDFLSFTPRGSLVGRHIRCLTLIGCLVHGRAGSATLEMETLKEILRYLPALAYLCLDCLSIVRLNQDRIVQEDSSLKDNTLNWKAALPLRTLKHVNLDGLSYTPGDIPTLLEILALSGDLKELGLMSYIQFSSPRSPAIFVANTNTRETLARVKLERLRLRVGPSPAGGCSRYKLVLPCAMLQQTTLLSSLTYLEIGYVNATDGGEITTLLRHVGKSLLYLALDLRAYETSSNNDDSGLGLVSCTALKWLHIQAFFNLGETTRPILLERMLRELLSATPRATSMGLELVLHRNSLRWFGELDEVVCQYAPDRGLMSVKVFWQEPADDRSWKLAQQRGRELSKEEQSRPKEIRDIKQFIEVATRKDATEARIKKIAPRVAGGKTKTKFKIRCTRYLYTLSLDDPEKAEKLRQSLPPGASPALHSYLYDLIIPFPEFPGLRIIDVEKDAPKKK